MIISGGVNIYPQETEDLLITPSQGRRRRRVRCPECRPRRGGEGSGPADAGRRTVRRVGDRTPRVLCTAPRQPEGAALDRLRIRTAALAYGQALQATAARPVLGLRSESNRVS